MKLFSNIIFFTLTICATAQISFTESSAIQNINVSYGYGSSIKGGISFFDYDNDGWDDLTFASGTGDPIYVFKNTNGIFSIVNLNFSDPMSENKQINWVDIDNDGDNDLFLVSSDASNKLFLNDGALNFTDITASAGISTATMNTFGASWGDYNNDGFLDLFLTNRNSLGNPNILYKNNGNNTFTDVSSVAGISTATYLSHCASIFDFNNDGFQDIYVSNDRMVGNILYKNNGNETFTDISVSSGTDIEIDAMSTTIDDYNNDGWLDIYVTNTILGNYLLKNNGDETFTNVADSNGTGFYSWAWGAVFLDADNDTDLDLYVSGRFDGTGGYLPSAFYENSGTGNFTIPTNAGFANDTAESYSNAIGDVNNDGLPDISVINESPDNNFLWINTNSDENNWVKVTLEGTTSNRMGIGSWIEISLGGNKQFRYTLNGEGYTSQNSGTEFFGLGNNSTVDYVKVTWLSGIQDIIYNVSANQKLHIVEGTSLSVSENKRSDLALYPNPTKGKITLKISLDNYQISLFDMLGAKIYSAFNLSNTSKSDFSHLKSGVYMLKISSDNKSFIKKIIIE